jgi:hypothetical protein
VNSQLDLAAEVARVVAELRASLLREIDLRQELVRVQAKLKKALASAKKTKPDPLEGGRAIARSFGFQPNF